MSCLFQPETKVESHLGKILGAVTFRDVWTDTAEVLIRQVGKTVQCFDEMMVPFVIHKFILLTHNHMLCYFSSKHNIET